MYQRLKLNTSRTSWLGKQNSLEAAFTNCKEKCLTGFFSTSTQRAIISAWGISKPKSLEAAFTNSKQNNLTGFFSTSTQNRFIWSLVIGKQNSSYAAFTNSKQIGLQQNYINWQKKRAGQERQAINKGGNR